MTKIRFHFSLVCITLVCFTANAQNVFNELQSDLDSWKVESMSVDNNQAKTRRKIVKYDNYIIDASFIKDELAQGQILSITDASKHDLLTGVVLSVGDQVSLQGIAFEENGVEKFGTFAISNMSDGSLCFKPKQSDEIVIKCTALDYVKGNDSGNPVILSIGDNKLASSDKSSREGYESISATLPTPVLLDAPINISTILSSISGKVKAEWNDRTFDGDVKSAGTESPVKFYYLTGTCKYADGKTVSVSKSESNLTMSVTDQTGNTEKYVVPASSINEQAWWSEKDFIKQAELYSKQLEVRNREVSSTESVQEVSSLQSSDSLSSDSGKGSSLEDMIVPFLILIAIIGSFLFQILSWWHSKKCPHCKKRFCLKVIDEQDLGVTESKRKKQSDGRYVTVYYHKIKYIKQCKHCGGIVTEVKEE